MEVIKEFAPEFQIELAAELGDSMTNLFGLGLKIFLIVKADRLHLKSSFTKSEK